MGISGDTGQLTQRDRFRVSSQKMLAENSNNNNYIITPSSAVRQTLRSGAFPVANVTPCHRPSLLQAHSVPGYLLSSSQEARVSLLPI